MVCAKGASNKDVAVRRRPVHVAFCHGIDTEARFKKLCGAVASAAAIRTLFNSRPVTFLS